VPAAQQHVRVQCWQINFLIHKTIKMKKNKTNIAKKAMVGTVAFLSLQGLPNSLYAQKIVQGQHIKEATLSSPSDPFLKFKCQKNIAAQSMSIVGILKGEPVFKNGKGELFIMNIATGDVKTISEADFKAIEIIYKGERARGMIKATALNAKINNSISYKLKEGIDTKIIGIDKDGHVIQETAKGEKFYLDAATGDMVDYVGHVTLLK
jgi:hypothetical protein